MTLPAPRLTTAWGYAATMFKAVAKSSTHAAAASRLVTGVSAKTMQSISLQATTEAAVATAFATLPVRSAI
ncbi:hypothetical protein D3C87_2055320 [compost metagenome]